MRLRQAAVGEHGIVRLAIAGGKLVVERLDIAKEGLALVTVLPTGGELIWRARDLVLESRADNALGGASERREEVRGGLARGTVEAHPYEEVLGCVARAEVDLATLVQDNDFVEHLQEISERRGR